MWSKSRERLDFARRVLLMFVATAVCLLTSCASTQGGREEASDDGEARFGLTDKDRIAALEAIEPATIDEEDLREQIKSIAWQRSASSEVRVAAVDALLRDDPADTGRMLALMLPTETDWEVIDRICALAIENNWTVMTNSLVRSWSRDVDEPADDDRPERAALLALHPGADDLQIVLGVLWTTTDEGLFAEKERQAAWQLLTRIAVDEEQDLAALATSMDATGGQPDIRALQQSIVDLYALPKTAEQLDWVVTLRKRENLALWDAATVSIADLDESARTDLEIRHAAVIAWAARTRPELVAATRESLLATLEERLRGRTRIERNVGPGESIGQSEALRDRRDSLTWGDLLSLLIADDLIHDESIRAALFEQADADRSDRSTEHGGAMRPNWRSLISESPQVRAISYLPRASQRVRDTEFITSPEMLEQGADALFYYHFHANRVRNRDYAGPSQGDLVYAERFGRSCLLFTTISADRISVDYYQPNGVIVDLGIIDRPPPASP